MEDLLAGAIFRTVSMGTIYSMQSSLTWLLIPALQQRKPPHKKKNLEVILESALRINDIVQRYNAQHISSRGRVEAVKTKTHKLPMPELDIDHLGSDSLPTSEFEFCLRKSTLRRSWRSVR